MFDYRRVNRFKQDNGDLTKSNGDSSPKNGDFKKVTNMIIEATRMI